MEQKSALNTSPEPQQARAGWSEAPSPPPQLAPAGPGGVRGFAASAAPSLTMEGAVLYQKKIDNSDVSYRHDPRDRDELQSFVSVGLFVALLFLVAFGPRLWQRHSGYRQAQLLERIEQLAAVRDELKVQKGRLEDLRRVRGLAEGLGLGETEPDRYKWLAPRPERAAPEAAVARVSEQVPQLREGRPTGAAPGAAVAQLRQAGD